MVVELTPGKRVRVTIEGVVVAGDERHAFLQLDDGSTWHLLPAAAKIEEL